MILNVNRREAARGGALGREPVVVAAPPAQPCGGNLPLAAGQGPKVARA